VEAVDSKKKIKVVSTPYVWVITKHKI